MPISPKAIYKFKVILKKIPMTLFTKTGKKILNLYGNIKDPQTAKAILSKKNNIGGITIPDFKRAIAAATTWYWHKNIHID
jgi:hypothetical protein